MYLAEFHNFVGHFPQISAMSNVQGVPAKNLLKEVSSYDTVGNAYFFLVIHALPAGWRSAMPAAAYLTACFFVSFVWQLPETDGSLQFLAFGG